MSDQFLMEVAKYVALCFGMLLAIDLATTFWMRRGFRKILTLTRRRFEVLSPEQVNESIGQLASAIDRASWERLVEAVRQATGGVVRRGHITWIRRVRAGAVLPPVPAFEPEGDARYRLKEDPGYPAVLNYQLALAQRRSDEHSPDFPGSEVRDGSGQPDLAPFVAELERAADRGSTAALAELGAALLSGEVPGRAREEGRQYMEEACKDSRDPRAAAMLGLILLQGLSLERDIAAGLRLTRRASALGNLTATLHLVWAHAKGEYGVPLNPTVATDVAVTVQMPRLRLLHRLGLRQDRCRDTLLREMEASFQDLAEVSFADARRQPRRLRAVPRPLV